MVSKQEGKCSDKQMTIFQLCDSIFVKYRYRKTHEKFLFYLKEGAYGLVKVVSDIVISKTFNCGPKLDINHGMKLGNNMTKFIFKFQQKKQGNPICQVYQRDSKNQYKSIERENHLFYY